MLSIVIDLRWGKGDNLVWCCEKDTRLSYSARNTLYNKGCRSVVLHEYRNVVYNIWCVQCELPRCWIGASDEYL